MRPPAHLDEKKPLFALRFEGGQARLLLLRPFEIDGTDSQGNALRLGRILELELLIPSFSNETGWLPEWPELRSRYTELLRLVAEVDLLAISDLSGEVVGLG
ncbi:MAG: hypothetical protein NZM37_11480 [Sandaracinaceae bacterium]|nr:hypothetical protein [Sandaracinaceae bacterium]